jgi:hypothetical protein
MVKAKSPGRRVADKKNLFGHIIPSKNGKKFSARFMIAKKNYVSTHASLEAAEQWVATERQQALEEETKKRKNGRRFLGSVSEKKNGKYMARVRVNGKRHRKTHETKEAAEEWINTTIAEGRKEGGKPPRRLHGTLRESKTGKFYATISVNRKTYCRTFVTRAEAEEWIENQRIKPVEEPRETRIKRRKRLGGTVYQKENKKWYSKVMVFSKACVKTHETREEAEAWIAATVKEAEQKKQSESGRRLHGTLRQKENGKWFGSVMIRRQRFQKTHDTKKAAEDWIASTRDHYEKLADEKDLKKKLNAQKRLERERQRGRKRTKQKKEASRTLKAKLEANKASHSL